MTKRVPTVEEAARIARTLVQRESLGNVGTIDVKGYPVSFSEYYVDVFDDGVPVLILLNVSSVNKNLQYCNDGKVCLSIRTGDHQPNDKVSLEYPGGISFSTAGSPRVNLKGTFEKLEGLDNDAVLRSIIEDKFVKRHPESKFWLPDSKFGAHSGYWVKLHIDEIYFVGGFGDRAYIGEIPLDLYTKSEPFTDKEYDAYAAELEAQTGYFRTLVDKKGVSSAV